MKKFISDIKRYKAYIFYATKSNLKADVAESHLKWIWWILEPLLFMFVYAFMALVVFGQGEKYFALFIFIGLTMWDLFAKSLNKSVKTVRNNRSIISKVYIPKYIIIINTICENFFKMVMSFVLVFIAMPFFGVHITFNIFSLIPILIVLIVFTFGLCCWALDFGVYFEDLSKLIPIALRLIFYMTGIFYSISSRVTGVFKTILLYVNPMAFLIDGARSCLLYEGGVNYWFLLMWFAIGVALSISGICRIIKNENSYVKII